MELGPEYALAMLRNATDAELVEHLDRWASERGANEGHAHPTLSTDLTKLARMALTERLAAKGREAQHLRETLERMDNLVGDRRERFTKIAQAIADYDEASPRTISDDLCLADNCIDKIRALIR